MTRPRIRFAPRGGCDGSLCRTGRCDTPCSEDTRRCSGCGEVGCPSIRLRDATRCPDWYPSPDYGDDGTPDRWVG